MGCDDQGVLRLAGTQVNGRLHLDIGGLHTADEGRPVAEVNGLTYAGLPEGATVSQWLTMLMRAAAYAPQPYQQLAAGCRAAGPDREASGTARQELTTRLRPACFAW